jgi:HupE / UreJ protein
LCGLLAFGAGASHAHKSSDAYLSLDVAGTVVTQRLDIALRDLDRDLDLDANGDGALSLGEVRSRWADTEQLSSTAVQIGAEGQICTPQAYLSPQLDEHTDGRYAVLRRQWLCAAPAQALRVNYRLFATTDPTHRGLLRMTSSAVSPDAAASASVSPAGVGEAAVERTGVGARAGEIATVQLPRDERSAVLIPGQGEQRFALGGVDPARADSDLDPAAGAPGFFGFVWEGLHHIAIGLDHILFLVTLLMVAVWRRQGSDWAPRASAASAWREALKLASAFTLAHSLTLGLAASGVLAPPSRWVESLIALSVLVAAVDNLRPFLRGPRWGVVSIFGLVHGFGFAGPLQDLGLRAGNLAKSLLGFNLGVELGQLLLVALLLPLACLWRARAFYRRGVVGAGSAAIGLLALGWTIERSFQIRLLP